MSIEQSNSDLTLPLTPISSFGALALVILNMAMSVGHPVVTSQVPTQVTTNTSIAATNPLLTTTNINQGTGSHSTHHDCKVNLAAVLAQPRWRVGPSP